MFLARRLNHPRGVVDLRAGRHEARAVGQRPAVVLHVRHLQAVGIERQGERNDLFDTIEVLAVHHHVDGQRQTRGPHQLGDGELLLMPAFEVADQIGPRRTGILEGNLHMIEPSCLERGHLGFVQQHTGSDEVAVEPCRSGGRDNIDEVLACGGLTAGEMDLHDAKGRRLADDVAPLLGGQFLAAALQVQRVGAIGALQRTAVGQFRQHGDGRAKRRLRSLLQRLVDHGHRSVLQEAPLGEQGQHG